jgi:Sec-independent protein translocase protein TatA
VFLFSPEKLLVILAVAMVVLGPDKLPKVAGQLGAMWRDLQKWRERIEHEAREVFPDLPPLETISQAVRSPLSYLDRLSQPDVDDTEAAKTANAGSDDPFAAAASVKKLEQDSISSGAVADPRSPIDTYDPSLN